MVTSVALGQFTPIVLCTESEGETYYSDPIRDGEAWQGVKSAGIQMDLTGAVAWEEDEGPQRFRFSNLELVQARRQGSEEPPVFKVVREAMRGVSQEKGITLEEYFRQQRMAW